VPRVQAQQGRLVKFAAAIQGGIYPTPGKRQRGHQRTRQSACRDLFQVHEQGVHWQQSNIRARLGEGQFLGQSRQHFRYRF
jgi:hypothetical protein